MEDDLVSPRSPKRVKLDPDSPSRAEVINDAGKDPEADEVLDEDDEDRCAICLQSTIDRTLLPQCSHEFCFDCVILWTGECATYSHLPGVIRSDPCRTVSQMPAL